MVDYERPLIPARSFTDEDGNPIPYGSRWEDSPPDDSYSVTSHTERFAPLQTIADALIEHLSLAYDVEVRDDPALASRDGQEISRGARAVLLTPASPDAAPLAFVQTDFPGVLLHAGALHRFTFPVCGCDACDDDWTTLADDLETTVFDVVAGRYEESITAGTEPAVGYRLENAGGSGTSRGFTTVDSPEQTGLDGRRLTGPWRQVWHPWPRRGAAPRSTGAPPATTAAERPAGDL